MISHSSNEMVDTDREPPIAVDTDREPPIAVASRECAEQLDKLTAMISELEDRLQPIRQPNPDDPGSEQAEKMTGDGHSRLAADLSSYAAKARYLQRRIRTLLEELEL